jgi:hypothetical protein
MTTIYVDFNDLTRPGCVYLSEKMQPNGRLPHLSEGARVLLQEHGDDDAFEAIVGIDPKSRRWIADMDAAAKVPRGVSSEASSTF